MTFLSLSSSLSKFPSKTFHYIHTKLAISIFFKKWNIAMTQKHQNTRMDYVKHSIGNPALLLFFLFGFFYLCIWSSSITNSFSVFQKESLAALSNTVSFNFQAYSFIDFTNMHMGFLNFVQKQTQNSFNSYSPTFMSLKMTSKKLYPKLQWQTKRSLSLS